MSVDVQSVRLAVEPVVARLGLDLYDVELTGSGRARVLRITVQNPSGPLDLDKLTEATHALDHVADELVPGAFELEVSSPGLERPLRRLEHFVGAVGETVSVKHASGGPTVRERGQLRAADESSITLLCDNGEEKTIDHDAISAAHTVFQWGPTPRPGSKRPRDAASGRKEPANS